jgi:hypothetical protein
MDKKIVFLFSTRLMALLFIVYAVSMGAGTLSKANTPTLKRRTKNAQKDTDNFVTPIYHKPN